MNPEQRNATTTTTTAAITPFFPDDVLAMMLDFLPPSDFYSFTLTSKQSNQVFKESLFKSEERLNYVWNNPKFVHTIRSAAGRLGRKDLLKLSSQKAPTIQWTYLPLQEAIKNRHIDCNNFLTELKIEIRSSDGFIVAQCLAIEFGHLDVLISLRQSAPPHTPYTCVSGEGLQFGISYCSRVAARHEHLHIIQWLCDLPEFGEYEQRDFGNVSMKCAASNGHLHILKWAYDAHNDGFWRNIEQFLNAAVIHGHLHIIEWARDLPEWTDRRDQQLFHSILRRLAAERTDALHILQWLQREVKPNSCWSPDVEIQCMSNALDAGNMKMYMWLHENHKFPLCRAHRDIEWKFLRLTIKDGNIDDLRWLQQHKYFSFPWEYLKYRQYHWNDVRWNGDNRWHTFNWGKYRPAWDGEVLKWLVENGCPMREEI